jgi:phage recombination protein Bet
MTVVTAEQATPLAIQPGQELFTDKQKAALAVLGIRDASNADLAVFMHYCQKTQLDPFSRQIYYIKRRENVNGQMADKWTIQVGIDGFRVIRDRAAQREGVTVDYEDTIWYDTDGGEHNVWLSADPPAACRVVLIKHTPTGDLRYPGVLRTAAYMAMKDGRPVSQWKTQPDHMIEKCCEAFANRRGFPHDLADVYIEEETAAARHVQPPPQRRVTAAEIIRDPEPEPERPARPRQHEGQPATPKALEEMTNLLAALPLGPDDRRQEDERIILDWLTGGWKATRAQARDVTAALKTLLEAAEGDVELAASNLWKQHAEATGQVTDDPA